MRNHTIRSLFVLSGALVLSLPAVAQVYYPGGRSDEQKKAAAASKATLKYDAHDLSGIWTHSGRPATTRSRSQYITWSITRPGWI